MSSRLSLPLRTPAAAAPARFGGALVVLGVLAGALLLRLATGVGFANYDTLYALVWGQQLAGGHTPQYGIALAPTPHPGVEALGFVLAPLGGAGAEDVTVALGLLALAACGWVVYRLGALWFGRAAGVLAAALVLTRVPILSYGVRAYVDVPYLVLVLGALLAASSPARGEPAAGPRDRGRPTLALALLACAGLLRPEAWAFAGLYWLYLARSRRRGAAGRRALAGYGALVLVAPALWLLSDLLVTGDALWSLTNTRHTAHELARATGIAKVPEYIPRRIGEILRPVVLVPAALGGMLGLLWLRSRVLLGAGAGFLAVLVFGLFASAGLPINTRYAFVAAAILCVFAAGGVLGWTQLPVDAEDARRRWWRIAGGALLVALVVSAPGQYRAADRELANLRRQQTIQDQLVALVDSGAISLRCAGAVGVPNHRPIPLLALRLDASPARIVSAQVRTLARGVYLDPASRAVQEDYILDRHDPHPLAARVPAGFAPAGGNRSWRLFERCS